MTQPVTVIAPIKLAGGKTEADLIEASDRFQQEFVDKQEGVLRRELLRKCEGEYIDVVQFRSQEDANIVFEREQDSVACQAFFAVMDLENDAAAGVECYPSLATYTR